MNRRSFVGTLGLGLLAAPLAAEARSIPRIGSLELTLGPPPVTPWRQGLLQGLADLGYVEGQNVVFVNRWAEGRQDRLPGLAAELLSSKVDVITSASTEAIIAARNLS